LPELKPAPEPAPAPVVVAPQASDVAATTTDAATAGEDER
jgi:hypothetical protein